MKGIYCYVDCLTDDIVYTISCIEAHIRKWKDYIANT